MTQRRRPSGIVASGGGIIVALALALPSVSPQAGPSCPTAPPVAPAKTVVPPELLDLYKRRQSEPQNSRASEFPSAASSKRERAI